MLKVCAQWQQFQKLRLFKLFLTTLFMQNASLLCLLWINSLLYLQTGGAKCASSIISSLGAMADPQLLHTVVPWLMLLLLWLLSPGEDLSHNPHHDIILKHNHACYCQYSHWVALCQRAAVLYCLYTSLKVFLLLCDEMQNHLLVWVCLWWSRDVQSVH